MISTSSELADVIAAGGAQARYVCDVIVDGMRKLRDAPLDSFTLSQDATARIVSQGSATFTYSDEIGQSIVPEDLTSWLTPFATYINVSLVYDVGLFEERIVIGRFKLTGVTNPSETKVRVAGRIITIGSSVNLNFADAFEVTDREAFPAPTSPTNTSAWAELAAITGLPVVKNVADVVIPTTFTYSSNRLDGGIALANVLGGIPYLTPANQIQIMPNTWPAKSDPLTVGSEGTIVGVAPADLTDQGIYNQVVGIGTDANQNPIYVTAQLTTGPLRYGGPFGRIPYIVQLPASIVDVPTAQAYVNALLPLFSTVPAAPFVISCLLDPRREIGDVFDFTRLGETLTGRVQKKQINGLDPMTLTVMVNRV